MKLLLATMIAVFFITFLRAPAMGAGLFWDAGNAFGFAAFAGLLYLAITSGRRLDVRAHQLFAYAVLALVLAHAFWFLLGDGAAVEFIKIGAPDYMWLGIAGLVSLVVLVMIANVPDRLHVHRDYPGFKYWHRVLTVVVIASAAYHIVVSNFYLGSWYQAGLFVLISLLAFMVRDYRARLGRIVIASPGRYLALSAVLTIVFAGFRNLPA